MSTGRRTCYGCDRWFNASDASKYYCDDCTAELNCMTAKSREALSINNSEVESDGTATSTEK